MQPVPGCRIRVWKKEWQQTVGSQTSLTTGTRRIANRNEQRSRGRKKKRTERKEVEGKERRKGGCKGECQKKLGKGYMEMERGGEVGGREAKGWFKQAAVAYDVKVFSALIEELKSVNGDGLMLCVFKQIYVFLFQLVNIQPNLLSFSNKYLRWNCKVSVPQTWYSTVFHQWKIKTESNKIKLFSAYQPAWWGYSTRADLCQGKKIM